MYITVYDLVNFVAGIDYFQICIISSDDIDTYKFDASDYPYELGDMTVESIDSPEYSTCIPLTMNIDIDDFDDYEVFKKKFKDYLVFIN